MTTNATGQTKRLAMRTGFEKSRSSKAAICFAFAPSVLRTPISWRRRSVTNRAMPNNPIAAMNMPMSVIVESAMLTRLSVLYSRSNNSSTKCRRMGVLGASCFQVESMASRPAATRSLLMRIATLVAVPGCST